MNRRALLLALWASVAATPPAAVATLLLHRRASEDAAFFLGWFAVWVLLPGIFTYLLLIVGRSRTSKVRVTPLGGIVVAIGAYFLSTLTVDTCTWIVAPPGSGFASYVLASVWLVWYPLGVGFVSGLAFQSVKGRYA